MIKSKTEFDELKCIFQEGVDSPEEEVHEIIEISSDHEEQVPNEKSTD